MKSPRATQLLGIALALVLILNCIDLFATITWVELGLAKEANPLMDALLQIHPVLFAAVKIALVSSAVMILWRFRSHVATHVAAAMAAVLYLGTYAIHAYGVVVTVGGG